MTSANPSSPNPSLARPAMAEGLAGQRPESSALAEISQETLALTKRLFVQLQRRPTTLVITDSP